MCTTYNDEDMTTLDTTENIAYIPYHIGIIWVSYHLVCLKFVPTYTQLLPWFVHFAKCPKKKKRKKLLSKRERAKKLVSKCHSIIPHCI